ncbi:MAG: OB-fold nucleic acid binding domain-containing protein, partial [Shimia sp.]
VLDRNRRRVFQSLDVLTAYSAAIHEQKASNQVSLFGDAGDDLPEPRLSPVEDWMPAERLAEEFQAIGFYLSGHPLDDYMGPLKRASDKGVPFHTLESLEREIQGREAMVAKLSGVVSARQERKSARGNRFAFVQLSDPTGAYEVTVFSDTLEAARDNLDTGAKVVVTVEATLEADQLKLLGRGVQPIDGAVANVGALGLKVFVDGPAALPSVATVLDDLGPQIKGAAKGPIVACLLDPTLPGEIEMELGGALPVSPQIKSAIKSLGGVLMVEDL